ncbi:uncharacterized protein LOC132698011 isoform X2 [Cylas formicarius]|uniref:uncharacterized protein LOC132698011 isoform X2 n=1 Tax=Cylas formicarius TaxID=197179 RepID=UPI002958AEA9|nr:uncharacterized protein LOC132698011 isoform X2 [Cylas formicarius]
MDRKKICTQSVKLSCDGFDLLAGETWIYPTNYPTREYQFNIIQKALLKNTLVSLPTGLGKTFVAAVIMYNFYRWYPQGKIIFMAPTKPLVKQQVDACYDVMAIPSEVTAELTGAKTSTARTDVWAEKRVFYITPQVLQNDLHRISELGPRIKCLVFDEAHKARGNHAYCEVIRRLIDGGNKHFRVLALSATPGGSVNDVLEVIQNLLISHIEFRTEESLDVQQYVFQRSLETVVVPLSDKLLQVRDEYLKILEHYTKSLRNYKIVQGNCGSLTKGKIFMLLKEFKKKTRGTRPSHYSEVMKSLNICVTLYHAYELLIRHGLRNFLSFFQEHLEKPLLRSNYILRAIVDDVRDHLGPIPNIEILPDGTYPEIPHNVKFGHPKFYKLRDVLVSHFSEGDPNTRVIVFFEYRESVMEAHMLLLQSRPLVQPKIFLGKGSGITQKFQIGVVKAFREGKCNTLLSTCIGEEGLDVGEVDLIVCFDISTKSPIRMVQRMGRTGRKRKDNISTFVLGSKQLTTGMYPGSPRMVPDGITPKCERIFITVKKKVLSKKNNSIKNLFNSISSTSSSEPMFLDDIQVVEVDERIPKCVTLFDKEEPLNISGHSFDTFSRHVESQRNLQTFYTIGPSKLTRECVKLMQYADSKRFNIPTQIQGFSQNKALKQGDIRSMFLQPNSQQHFQTPFSKIPLSIDKIISTQNLRTEREASPPHPIMSGKELYAQISNYIFLHLSSTRKCKHCPDGFTCEDYTIASNRPDVQNNNWIPSEQILNNITAADIADFTKTLDPNYKESVPSPTDYMEIGEDHTLLEHIDFTHLERNAEEQSFNFQAPKTLTNIIDKFGEQFFYSQNDISELLHFFMLPTLLDLFCGADSSQETVLYSPNVSAEDSPRGGECLATSPDLSSQDRLRSIRRKVFENTKRTEVQKQLVKELNIKEVRTTICSTPIRQKTSSLLVTPSMRPKSDIDISDICDVSSFGLSEKDVKADVSEFCDLSMFGITIEKKSDVRERNKDNANTDYPKKNLGRSCSKFTNIVADAQESVNLLNATDNSSKEKEKPICQRDYNRLEKLNQNSAVKDIPYSKSTKTSINAPSTSLLEANCGSLSKVGDDARPGKKNYEQVNTKPKNLTNQASTSWSLLDQKFGKDTNPLEITTKAQNLGVETARCDRKTGFELDKPDLASEDSDSDVTFCEPPAEKEEPAAAGLTNIDDNLLDLVDESIIELLTQTNKPHIKETTVDLTKDSPEKPLPKKLSAPTQLSITQMLTLINKSQQKEIGSSQKENESNNINQAKLKSSSSSEPSSADSRNRTSKKNLLSTKKDIDGEFSFPTPKKNLKKPNVDPYQIITQRVTNRKSVLGNIPDTSSDEEFENPKRNPVFLKPLSETVNTKSMRNGNPNARSSKTTSRKKTRKNPFIEEEAKLSEDENVFISDDESDGELDVYDSSFVNDETQNMNTQMHLHYLKSMRSPAPRRLKVPSKPPLPLDNIYSQNVDTENDAYIEDSFVVDAKDDELTQRHDLSELEILERKLKQKKRKKSEEKSKSDKPKRRRIVSISSDDST